MPAIAKHNEVITAIFSLATEPSRQQELIDLMIDALLTTTKHQPVFVSASFHKSLDGTRVFNYAQLRTQAEYEGNRSGGVKKTQNTSMLNQTIK